MAKRTSDYIGGHINDQSDLQSVHFNSLLAANAHQDQEMEALRLQTKELSVKFHCLLWDHIALIQHIWALQNTLAINLFFRPLLPITFVLSLAGINGSGLESSPEPSDNSNADSSPSTPSHSYQTCVSGGSLPGEGICPLVRSIRMVSVWFPPEIVYPFQSSPTHPDATSDGGDEPGDSPWRRDGEGSLDGYVVGDEASSSAQHIQVQELSVGGEEGKDDVEAM